MEKGLIVYTNPASNTLNISIEQNMRENITVRLFDMQGKMILEQNEEAKGYFQTQVGLSNLASGVYQLQIQTEGSILNYKIIKQ